MEYNTAVKISEINLHLPICYVNMMVKISKVNAWKSFAKLPS